MTERPVFPDRVLGLPMIGGVSRGYLQNYGIDDDVLRPAVSLYFGDCLSHGLITWPDGKSLVVESERGIPGVVEALHAGVRARARMMWGAK